jgi:glycosyltransferase domain-containing protein
MKIKNEDMGVGYNILIPTYNRPDFLKRILTYYNSYRKNYKIIVGDSSSDKNKKINKQIITPASNLNIHLLDQYSTEINPFHKIADMLNYVDEEYCVLCADDDFVIPNGIEKSVTFLKENSDFTCAHGKYIHFFSKTKNNTEQSFRWGPIEEAKSLDSSDAKERLIAHFEHYNHTFYAVHRTDFSKMIFTELFHCDIDPKQFGELMLSMLSIIYGKRKILDVLYAARQAASKVEYWPSLVDYMKTGIFEEEYSKFRDCLAYHLSKNSSLDIEVSKQVVDYDWQRYMQTQITDRHEDIKHLFLRKTEEYLSRLQFPDDLDENMRRLYRKFFLHVDNPHSIYYNDFAKIRDCVIAHAKK